MENRLESLRQKVDELVSLVQRDKQRYFFVHLYGVSHFGAMLAIRRGLDAELSSACGMLHDIYAVISGSYDNHAINGSIEAKKFLNPLIYLQIVRLTLLQQPFRGIVIKIKNTFRTMKF